MPMYAIGPGSTWIQSRGSQLPELGSPPIGAAILGASGMQGLVRAAGTSALIYVSIEVISWHF